VKVYINGMLYEPEDAKVHVLGEGFLRGLGVRDTFVCRDRKFFHLDERLLFLQGIAPKVQMPFPWQVNDIKEALAITCEMSGFPGCDGVVRLILSAGMPERKVSNEPVEGTNEASAEKKISEIEAALIVIPMGVKKSDDKLPAPIAVMSLPNAPISGEMLLLERNLQCGPGTAFARNRAREKGNEEALILDGDGTVAACTGGDIYAIRDGTIWVPETTPASPMQENSVNILKDLGHNCNVQPLTVRDLQMAKECFLVSNLGEIRPIAAVDGGAIGDKKTGPTTQSIAAEFGEKIRSACQTPF
jgi:branched-chain amino acid aminotransferase